MRRRGQDHGVKPGLADHCGVVLPDRDPAGAREVESLGPIVRHTRHHAIVPRQKRGEQMSPEPLTGDPDSQHHQSTVVCIVYLRPVSALSCAPVSISLICAPQSSSILMSVSFRIASQSMRLLSW